MLQRSREMRSEYASDESALFLYLFVIALNHDACLTLAGDVTDLPLSPGHVEKLVSLQNSNIHTSSTTEERSALPHFQQLLNQDQPDIRSIHDSAFWLLLIWFVEDLKLLVQQAECCPPESRAQTWQVKNFSITSIYMFNQVFSCFWDIYRRKNRSGAMF